MPLSPVPTGLCLYESAVIIRCQSIIQNIDIFFTSVVADGSFQVPPTTPKFPLEGIPPGRETLVLTSGSQRRANRLLVGESEILGGDESKLSNYW